MIVKTLTIRRLDTTIREFRLLHFNLTAARAFFQVAPFSLFLKIERNNNRDTGRHCWRGGRHRQHLCQLITLQFVSQREKLYLLSN